MNWWVISTNKFVRLLNYIECFLILASAITGCISISAFASLLGVSIVIPSSTIRSKICAIATGIKKFKKKHDKIVFLTKTKLNSIEVLICKALTDSYPSHDRFILVKNVLKEFDDMKEDLWSSLKCKKIQNIKTRELQRPNEKNQFFYQNVRCVTVKNQDLLKKRSYWITK